MVIITTSQNYKNSSVHQEVLHKTITGNNINENDIINIQFNREGDYFMFFIFHRK